MRFRSSVAIDLGTVNTLVWVAGRGIVLDEPTAIAIDTAVGKVAAVGEAAEILADKEPQDIQVIHPLRDGVIADLDATAAMLHAFLKRARRRGFPLRPDALVCVPSGATPVERRSIMAALSVRRPRYNVQHGGGRVQVRDHAVPQRVDDLDVLGFLVGQDLRRLADRGTTCS
jgi:actin-like ATPase involved in cell morphogenesis